jgi:hypothetical protein
MSDNSDAGWKEHALGSLFRLAIRIAYRFIFVNLNFLHCIDIDGSNLRGCDVSLSLRLYCACAIERGGSNTRCPASIHPCRLHLVRLFSTVARRIRGRQYYWMTRWRALWIRKRWRLRAVGNGSARIGRVDLLLLVNLLRCGVHWCGKGGCYHSLNVKFVHLVICFRGLQIDEFSRATRIDPTIRWRIGIRRKGLSRSRCRFRLLSLWGIDNDT